MTIDECTARILAGKAKLDEFRLGAWLRAEPSLLPRWKRMPRSFTTLPDGQVVVNGQTHSMRTRYLRRDWNENDVALLRQVVDAQPRTFASEQTMALKSKQTIDAAEIARVRKGI